MQGHMLLSCLHVHMVAQNIPYDSSQRMRTFPRTNWTTAQFVQKILNFTCWTIIRFYKKKKKVQEIVSPKTNFNVLLDETSWEIYRMFKKNSRFCRKRTFSRLTELITFTPNINSTMKWVSKKKYALRMDSHIRCMLKIPLMS